VEVSSGQKFLRMLLNGTGDSVGLPKNCLFVRCGVVVGPGIVLDYL